MCRLQCEHQTRIRQYLSYLQVFDERQPLVTFLTNTVAVLGGLYTIAGLLDGLHSE